MSFSLSSCTIASDPEGNSGTSAILESINLVSYTESKALVKVIGSLPRISSVELNEVIFHTKLDCSDDPIGRGLQKDFLTTGIEIQVFIDKKTDIYIQSNTSSECHFLGSYTFTSSPPEPPTLSKMIPASPSRTSTTPTLFGKALPNSKVYFYKEPNCSTLLGNGSANDFSLIGIILNVPSDSQVEIYGQTRDPLNKVSICQLLTTYQHISSGPDPVVFSSTAPASPNNQSTNPTIKGVASSNSETVALYKDPGCSDLISSGTAADFNSIGFSINVNQNVSLTIYAKALDGNGNPSVCSYLTSYLFDNVAPLAPVFNSTNPTSPTRLTIYPQVKGIASVDTATVKFYNSPLCLVQTGLGSKMDFEGSGVFATVVQNSITPIYAKSFDFAGNGSACTYFLDFKNQTIAPDIPAFGGTTPASPNNLTPNPLIFGTASETTVSLDFYSDSTCNSSIGSGTASSFNGSGIQLNTPNIPNSINLTPIYATATDTEGNVSTCTQIATYGYSTAAAANATFIGSVPLSPSRTSTTPFIVGSAPISVAQVYLFKDVSCTQQIGSSTKNVFFAQGIQVNVLPNSVTTIYSKTLDVYGNYSNCSFLTSYTHDNVPLFDPLIISSTPSSPNNASSNPSILGSVVINVPGKILPMNQVKLYDSFLCINEVGSGTPNSFTTTGIQSTLVPNSVNSVYARAFDAAGNKSNCAYLLDYLFDNIPPGNPSLASATPMTPSYTRETNIVGVISSSQNLTALASVSIYLDSLCTNLITSVSPAQFTSSGVLLTSNRNTTTPFYAQVQDAVGNRSSCSLLVNFLHNDIGPANLMTTQNIDGSVNLNWNTDNTASPSPKYIIKKATKSGGPYTVIEWNNSGNSFKDSSVSNNKNYYYVVAATNNTGTSNNSSEAHRLVSAGAAQTATMLAATPGAKVVELSWQGYSPDMYYKVLRSTQHGGPYTEIKSGITSTTYKDTTPSNGTTYFYVVKGANPNGVSVQSNEAVARVLSAPSAPQNLEGFLIMQNPNCAGNPGITLTWTAPSYYSAFMVRRSAIPQSTQDYITTSATSYTDCNLNTNDTNFRANHYSVQTLWGPSSAYVRSPLSQTVGFSYYSGTNFVVNPGDNKMILSWTDIYPAESYQVWRSDQAGWPNSNYVLLDGNVYGTVYTDNTALNGTAYFYMVLANYQNNQTGGNGTEVGRTPSATSGVPSNLQITEDKGSGNPSLGWSAPEKYNYFNIYRSTALGGPYGYVGSSYVNSYIDNLSTPDFYYYQVVSVWGQVESPPTNIQSYRFGITNVTATASASQITLNFSSVSGANQYQIYRSLSETGSFSLIDTVASSPFVNSSSSPAAHPALSGQGYFYSVRPSFPDGTFGQHSSKVNAQLTSDNVPSGLTIVASSASSISLKWAKINNATLYYVYKATTSAGPYTLATTVSTNEAFVGGLIGNTDYYFKVESKVGTQVSNKSNFIQGLPVDMPEQPSYEKGNNQISLSWTALAGATSYILYRSSDLINYTPVLSSTLSTSFSDVGVTNGSIYFYKLEAVFSLYSWTSESTKGITPGITPAAPQGLALVETLSSTSVKLSWTSVSSANLYKVYLSSVSGGPWGTAVLSSSATIGIVLTGLTTGAVYYACVTALNGLLESGCSSEISFIPITPPSAPLVVATGVGIDLSWGSVAGAATYDIYRSTNKFIFEIIATGIAPTGYSDLTATAGQHYYYRYDPWNPSGNPYPWSAPSVDIVFGSSIAIPASLSLLSLDASNVVLNWAPSSQAANYKIYRSPVSGSGHVLINTLSASLNEYTDSGLSAGTDYYYTVSAVNSSGVESGKSNEVGIRMVTGPTSISTSNVANKVQISWSSLAGASSYVVSRSDSSGGPYGSVGTTASNSLLDSNIVNGKTYYYVVEAKFSGTIKSAISSESSISAIKVMNLQVPIELTDQTLASDVMAVTFNRAQVSLDTSEYDGTVSYDFEILATNADSNNSNVEIVDSSGITKATVIIPSGTSSFTRLRSSFIPNAGFDFYQLKLSATTNNSDVKIEQARILVTQVGASKTKVFIPLLASSRTPSSIDGSLPVESTTNNNYFVLNSSTEFIRDLTKYSKLIANSPWEFEVIVSSNGGKGVVSLFNQNLQLPVEDTEIEFSDSALTIVNSPFNDEIQNFSSPANDLNIFKVAMRCTKDCNLGAVNIYKAGIWISLSDLSKVELIFRNSLAKGSLLTPSIMEGGRTLIDLSQFSNPIFNFRVIASAPAGLSGDFMLLTGGVLDSGTAGTSIISGSNLSFSTMAPLSQQTVAPLSLIGNDRYMMKADPNGGELSLLESAITVNLSP